MYLPDRTLRHVTPLNGLQRRILELLDLSPEVGVGEPLATTWDFAKLLEMGAVDAQAAATTLKRITQNPELGVRFLAWTLYGYVHKQTADGKGIKSPILFAQRRAAALPEPDYLTLARRSPQALADLRSPYTRTGLPLPQSQILDALDQRGFFTLLPALTGSSPVDA
ncbi:MAG: hypothetical protein HUU38_01745 [Anaerolineales bacterium]|nr:hypothetical protein [Anaerolineales bacterium]